MCQPRTLVTAALCVEEEPESSLLVGMLPQTSTARAWPRCVTAPEGGFCLHVVVGPHVTPGLAVRACRWCKSHNGDHGRGLVCFQPRRGREDGERLWISSALGISYLPLAQRRRVCGAQLFFHLVLGAQVSG